MSFTNDANVIIVSDLLPDLTVDGKSYLRRIGLLDHVLNHNRHVTQPVRTF